MKRLASGLLALALALTLTHVAQGESAHRRHHQAQRTAVIDRNSFAVANSHVIRVRHDRAWWVARFPHARFVLFGGGDYYSCNGYWSPAYGYNPYYSVYLYDGPIYGYNNYAPGQVIENVQVALR